MPTDKGRERALALIAQARATNAQRDKDERAAGFGAVSDCGPFEIVRTAMFAIEAGLHRQDWPCVAEAYVMLEDVTKRFQPVPVTVQPKQKA